MTEQDYFNSPAIGSSVLGQAIVRAKPLEVCLDLATIPVKPTSAMEEGKMFEDLVKEGFSGKPVFSDKYFKSNLSSFPSGIIEIIESENIKEAVKNGYNYKQDGDLNMRYGRKHHCLDQITAHDYRRPIPEPTWGKLQIMLKRFKNYPFKIGDVTKTLWTWQTLVKIEFQVEYFWKHESGAECRAKFDMIWMWTVDGIDYAILWDLKVTGNWQKFKQNWKSKYIWQTKHYLEGFVQYCVENGLIPHPQMPYLIQESAAPQITHARALSVEGLDYLSAPYDKAIPLIWEWIEAGKPVKGFVEQQIVDRWGRVDE